MESSRYLASEDESLVMCPRDDLWVDVDAFEEAAAAARRSRDPAAFRVAIEFYSGELLPQDCYEGWTEARREELRQLHLMLLTELAELYKERDEPEPAMSSGWSHKATQRSTSASSSSLIPSK
jgi:DNA-binding SARP family transcriptional activator